MSRQTFKTVDVLRLQIEDDWPGLPNIVPNPTGEFGAWGWGHKLAGGFFTNVPGGFQNMHGGGFPSGTQSITDYMQIVPSDGGATRYVRSTVRRFGGTTGKGFTLSLVFYDAARAFISQSTPTTAQTVNGTKDTGSITVPTNAKYVKLIVDPTTSANLQYVEFTDVVVINGTNTEVAMTVEPSWVDLLSPATEIEITTEELNVGILNAVVRDSTLDPSQSDVIRKGKRVRVTALDAGTGLWELLFRGTANIANVSYDLLYPVTGKRARITLQAVDPNTVLAGTPRSDSVAAIPSLAATLDEVTVPWNINGSTKPIWPLPTVTAQSESASALDQVAITRDTARGYAWTSRKGILNVWDRANISGTVAAVLDEDDYTDLNLGYATDDLLNDVTVIVREINNAGETVETRYGPYANDISAREHGRSHADFTVTGTGWTEATAAAYAANLLATNPVPRVRVKSLRMPVKTAAHITPARALLDLYDKVTVNNTASGIAQDLRITRRVHTITPEKWTMEIAFAEVGGVAAPQAVPPLAATPQTRDAAVTVDANATAIYSGCRVYRRGEQGTLAFEIKPNIAWATTWPLLIVPAGYLPSSVPPGRFWVTASVVGSTAVTYSLRLDSGGGLYPEVALPAGVELIGSVSYPLA